MDETSIGVVLTLLFGPEEVVSIGFNWYVLYLYLCLLFTFLDYEFSQVPKPWRLAQRLGSQKHIRM
jgi:hypothetical protein